MSGQDARLFCKNACSVLADRSVFRFCQDARKADKTEYHKADGAVRIFVVIYMGGNDNPTN